MRFLTGDAERADYDAIVVGSGAAGLLAAAVAAERGLKTLVLEKAPLVGGTSAISAGTVWVPCNPYAAEQGIADDPAQAAQYLRAVADGGTPPAVLDAIVRAGGEMLDFAREHCGLLFDSVADYPDYRPSFPGAASGGRSLQPRLFDTGRLGDLGVLLRRDPVPPYTMGEFKAWGSWNNFPWDELRARAAAGIVARGAALVGPLFAACAERGVTIAVDAAVDELLAPDGVIAGVVVEGVEVRAPGVVLASGGFEWDAQLLESHLDDRLRTRCSPPYNTGDAHRMVTALGAQLANLDQAWWAPMALLPGEERDGRPIGRLIRTERQGPGTIMVNRHGRRFTDESQNYNTLVRTYFQMAADDPQPDPPMYVIFDQRFLDRFGFITHRGGEPVPEWLTAAPTVAGLADVLGVDAAGLEKTILRFNEQARAGSDDDFQRGADRYDRYGGDPDNPYPNPCLAPLDVPPYYGMPLVAGAFGTSGGAVTDEHARVLGAGGATIAGLYAVGNASSHPVARGYPGAGGTLGPALTMAYSAGLSIGESDAAE